MTSSSRIEPPGWMTAVAPASIADKQPVGEGEEGVGGDDRALGQRLGQAGGLGRVERLARGDARGIDAAHLAGADADGGAVPCIDDGVRLDVLGDAEGEFQIGHLGRRRRALRHDLELQIVDHRIVAALDEQAAGNGFDGGAGGARIGQAAGDQQAQVLLGGDDADCLLEASGAMMTSVKVLTISSAASASRVRFIATMPPKAETGSQASALA